MGPSSVVASLLIKMGLDPSGVQRGAAQVDKTMAASTQKATGLAASLQKFGGTTLGKGLLGGIGLGAGFGGAMAVSMAVSKTIDVMGDAITMASDLAETQSKLDQVYDTTADSIREWAATTDAALVTTKNDLLAATATFGNFLQAMGTAERSAADMSMDLVDLAADLASFNNTAGGTEEVLVALRSGMAGEAEAARRLGIDLGANRIEAILLADGVEKVNGEFTQGQKIAARYKAIMKDTAKAQGDVARTSEGFANKSRTLSVRLAELQTSLGELILPGALAVVTFLTDVLGVIEDLTAALPKVTAEAEKMADAVGGIVGRDVVNDFANLVRIVGTGGIALATDAPNKLIDAAQDIQAGREIAEDAVGGIEKMYSRMGHMVPPDLPDFPAPDIAGPIRAEMADAVVAIKEGFGNVKAAFAAPPQLISRSDRLENMQKRISRINKNIHKAVKADDPWNVSYWTSARAKVEKQMAGLGGKARTSMKGVRAALRGAAGDVAGPVSKAAAAVDTVVTETKQKLGGMAALAADHGTKAGTNYATGIGGAAPGAGAAAGTLTTAAGTVMTGSIPKAATAGRAVGRSYGVMIGAQSGAAAAGSGALANAAQVPLAASVAPAAGYGRAIGGSYASGLRSQVPSVAAAAAALAAAAAAPIKTESPPKVGPLRHIEAWGPQLVDLWTRPMLRKVGDVEKVGERLGRAMTPRWAPAGTRDVPGWDRASRAGVRALEGDGVRPRREVHYHVGTLIATPAGFDELDRRTERRRRHRERGAGRRASDPN